MKTKHKHTFFFTAVCRSRKVISSVATPSVQVCLALTPSQPAASFACILTQSHTHTALSITGFEHMEEQRGDELHKFRLETDQTNHPYPIHGWLHRPCMRTVTAQWPHMGGWKLLQACPSCVSLVLPCFSSSHVLLHRTTGVKCSSNKGVFTGVATELMMSRVVTLPEAWKEYLFWWYNLFLS